jgi:RNA polymerase sigma factor for flagellar operon FliA
MRTPRPQDPPDVVARVEEGLPVVDMLASQLRSQLGSRVEHGDLVSFGREGLLTAARSFDPERGVPFRRWANIKIRGAIIDGVRQLADIPRALYRKLRALEAADRVQETLMEEDAASPARDAEAADVRLQVYLASMATAMSISMSSPSGSAEADQVEDGSPSPEARIARRQLVATVRAAIASRPEAECKLLERHYIDGITFEKAAAELGLSKSWASRLHARALEGVAREMKRMGIDGE